MRDTNEMEVIFDSCSSNERFARVAVAAFLTQLNPTVEEVSDVKTAVSEAVTNSIIHGYDQEIHKIRIQCRIDQNLFMVTKKGIVKKTSIVEYSNVRKNGLIAINLRDDDELIEVKTTNKDTDILLVTKFGMCIRFKETDVRGTGRSSMGVIGMNLADGDEVVGMQLDTQGDELLIVSENGMGKRTNINEFTVQRRGGKGIKCYKIVEKTGNVVGVKAVSEEHEIMMITTEGIIIQIRMSDVSILGRITSGVKLINLENGVKVAKIAKVREKIEGEDTAEEEEAGENQEE